MCHVDIGGKKDNVMFLNSYMFTVLVQIEQICFNMDRPSKIKNNGKILISYIFLNLHLALPILRILHTSGRNLRTLCEKRQER